MDEEYIKCPDVGLMCNHYESPCLQRYCSRWKPEPAPSGEPVEPGVFDLTVRLEVYKVDISGAYRGCPPDVRLFAMFNGHEFEVGKLNGQWSKPKEPE